MFCNKTTHLILYFSVLFGGYPTSNTGLAQPPEQQIDKEELFDSWSKWAAKVASIQPRHVVSRLESRALLDDFGYLARVRDSYRFHNRFFVLGADYNKPINSSFAKTKHSVTFYREDLPPAKNGMALVRNSPDGGWYIAQRANCNLDELVDDLNMVGYIPGALGVAKPIEMSLRTKKPGQIKAQSG